jgi:hypothetical protein
VARGKWLRLVLGELTNTFAEGGEGRGEEQRRHPIAGNALDVQ